MRITWLSNAPWAQTGYGTQTRINVPRIKAANNDIQIAALYGLSGGVLNWNGVPVLPNAFHPYGQDIIGAHSAGADIMISLLDAWVCQPENYPDNMRWVPWFPIDSEPLQPLVRVRIEKAYHRIVMSGFGARMMDDAGLDYSYIPHGIETDVFKPIDRMQARITTGLPADAFIVGMVAANKGYPSRKAFTQQIEAFTEFKKKRSDAVLYIHAGKSEHGENSGINLPEFIAFCGLEIGKDVFFPDQYQNLIGFPDDWMNALYNSFDVLLSVSMGEGFGIPIVEAQSAGCPVIVGGWTSMDELCFSGWKLSKAEAEPAWTNLGAYQYSPHAGAIAERLHAAYSKKDNEIYRERARAGALAYDADKVFADYWLPTLKLISDKISAEKEAVAGHTHQWAKIGLFDGKGGMSTPCVGCWDELSRERGIIKDGFKPSFPLKFVPDTDGITRLVCREIERDYKLDNLDLKDGDTIVDIGAHKGIVSCYLGWKYPQARVLSYEPVKVNYDAMLENIKLNGLTNIIPFNLAVTSDGRDVLMAVDTVANSGGSTMMTGDGDLQEAHSVRLLDIFVTYDITRLALLKIDCEGGEYEILGNAWKLLDRVDHLRGEFHRAHGSAGDLELLCKAHIPDVVVTIQG